MSSSEANHLNFIIAMLHDNGENEVAEALEDGQDDGEVTCDD